MNKRPNRAERRAAASAKPSMVAMDRAAADGYQNFAAGIGIGTDNIAASASYSVPTRTNRRQELENMYAGSWIVGQAVDAPAEDMTRAGIEIVSDDGPEVLDEVYAELDRLQVSARICDALKWSRLYGGSIAVHLVEGQDPSTPLRKETVGNGQYRGVLDLDRWSLQPSNATVTEYGPDLGRPESYLVLSDAPALGGQTIHHSRIIRFDGENIPYRQRLRFNGWGMSVVERLFDRLVAFDSTTLGAAQLVYKAHLRTARVKDLRSILAAGGAAEAALIKQFQMMRQMQTNEGLSLLDAEDEFDVHTYTFSGLSDVLMQFAQQISGALQIPLVRLFGQSPAGLNSTGESDIRAYYDRIEKDRERALRGGYGTVVDLTYRSVTGRDPPKGFRFDFRSLWQMSDKEKADIAVAVTTAVSTAEESGLVTKATALRELRQSADVTGVWSNISVDEIQAAEDEPPPAPEAPIAETTGEGGETIAEVSLNGAQVASMVDIVAQVASGAIPRETGVELIRVAYPVSAQEADKIMGAVGRGFSPAITVET